MRALISVCALSLLLPSSAAAQAEAPAVLTLDAAVAEALAGNLALKAARENAAAAALAPAVARGLAPPMLEAQIWRWPLTTLNPTKVDMVMFMGEQTLPARGRRAAAARLAEKEAGVAIAAVHVLERDVTGDVAAAFVDALTAQRTLAAYDRAASGLREVGEAALARYATGGRGPQDVLDSVLALSRLEQDRITAREARRKAEVRLNTLLGREPGAPVGTLAPSASFATLPLETRLAAASSVPEAHVVSAERDAAQAAVDLTAVDHRPEFRLRGGYMLEPGSAGAWTASVGISWPNAPWSRRGIDAREAQQRARLGAIAAESAAATHAARALVQEAAVALDAARARAALVRSTVMPQATQSLDVARVAYTAAQVDFLRLVEAQRMRIEAEIELVRAEGEVLLAAAALDRATGGVR